MLVYHCRPTRERGYDTKSFGPRSNIHEDLKSGELTTFISEVNGKEFPVASKFDEPLLDKINSKDK